MTYLLKHLLKFAALKVDNTTAQVALASCYGLIDIFGVVRGIKILHSVYQEQKRNARN